MAAKATELTSFTTLWQVASEQRQTDHFHQVITTNTARQQLFSVGATLRSAMRYADGLQSLMKFKAGDRVAIIAEGFGELVPFYHALWLLGCTIVAVPHNQHPDLAVSQINNSGCRALVYSPALAARLASIIPRLSGIDAWIVCGVGRSSALGSGRAVVKLEELHQSSSRNVKLEQFKKAPSDDVSPALIAFTAGQAGDPKGVAFSERALIAAATNQATLYNEGSKAERFASLLPDKNFVSLVHMLIVPLVAPITSVIFPEYLPATKGHSLVEELYDNQVHAVWMHEDRLDEVRQATKAQRFVLAKNFKLFLLPRYPLPTKFFEGIGDLIVPCYGQTEAGGIIAAGTMGQLFGCATATRDKTPVLAAGAPISGVKFRIVGSSGNAVAEDKQGELTVLSQQVMSGYEATAPGGAFIGPDLAFHTGDRAQWSFNREGKPHLVVLGRDEQFIRRGSAEVNILDLESILRRVLGVKDARVVGFPHEKQGRELGAFVLLQKKAQVTREALWSNLLAFFPWELVPKMFMIADSSLVEIMPSRSEIEEKFAKYATADFSRAPKL